MEECGSVNSPHGRNASIVNNEKSYTLNGPDGSTINIGHGLSKVSVCLCLKVHFVVVVDCKLWAAIGFSTISFTFMPFIYSPTR